MSHLTLHCARCMIGPKHLKSDTLLSTINNFSVLLPPFFPPHNDSRSKKTLDKLISPILITNSKRLNRGQSNISKCNPKQLQAVRATFLQSSIPRSWSRNSKSALWNRHLCWTNMISAAPAVDIGWTALWGLKLFTGEPSGEPNTSGCFFDNEPSSKAGED